MYAPAARSVLYIYNKVKTLTMFRIKKLDIFIAKQY